MPAAEALKQQAAAVVDDVATELLAASREIHARPELGYEEVFASGRLASLLSDHHLEQLGRRFVEPELIPASVAGSTDMGNVSQALPAIHPVLEMSPLGVAGHSQEMARWAASERADAVVVDGAKALAMTGVDLWLGAELRAAAWEEHGGRPEGG